MNDSAARVRLTDESEHALTVLRRGLERASSFALFVVLASDFARAEVLRRLVSWSGQGRVPEMRLFPSGPEAVGELERFLVAADKGNPLAGAIVPYAEVLLEEEEGQGLRSLNMARDVLGRLIVGPLVMVLPEAKAGEFAAAAEDLWDVRAGTIVIAKAEAEAEADAEAEAVAEAVADPVAVAAAEAEAARLREREASGEVDAGALADAYLSLAYRFTRAGGSLNALHWAAHAEMLGQSVHYTSLVARALHVQAEIAMKMGQIDLAIQKGRNAVDAFSSSEMLILKDMARWTLALALMQAGRTAEALGELRNAYRDLTPLTSIIPISALVLDTIADAHEAGGEIDEALRVRRRELPPMLQQVKVELPIDNLQKIARLLLRRDAPGDREEAARMNIIDKPSA